MNSLSCRRLTKSDYDRIVNVIDSWWGGPTTALAHPLFFYELGELAQVVESQGQLVGFLFGFIAPKGPTGYVHLVGIDPEFRRQQVGSLLYLAFEQACREAACPSMKALTAVGDASSVHFHESLGWTTETREDYAGPGRARHVFVKALEPAKAAAAQ